MSQKQIDQQKLKDEERMKEVNFVVNMIQGLCEEAKICIFAKERKGIKMVCIHDNIDDKDYMLSNNKEE